MTSNLGRPLSSITEVAKAAATRLRNRRNRVQQSNDELLLGLHELALLANLKVEDKYGSIEVTFPGAYGPRWTFLVCDDEFRAIGRDRTNRFFLARGCLEWFATNEVAPLIARSEP